MTLAHLLLALLTLQAACNMSAQVKPYEPLPGTVTGYIVVVKAPPGAEVLLVPAPNAPPIPLHHGGREAMCWLYVSQPMSIAPGASVIVVHRGVRVRLPLVLPGARKGDVATVKPAPYTSRGDILGVINSSIRHGILENTSTTTPVPPEQSSQGKPHGLPGATGSAMANRSGAGQRGRPLSGASEGTGFLVIGLASAILLGGLVLRLLYAQGWSRASEAGEPR